MNQVDPTVKREDGTVEVDLPPIPFLYHNM
jgi:hypothetical protein